ncbi:MAG TPA: type II toxin-antitoxin system RelE/ParE family toxin [Azospirillum sp.]|nr:type II toxin-antitoxin system RelE/ParE family toxin [Azospirillum sp.]
MPRLTFAPAALDDLDNIAAHIGADNPDAAGRFIQRIKATCRLIAERPMMGRARHDLLPELRGFPVGNYLIF